MSKPGITSGLKPWTGYAGIGNTLTQKIRLFAFLLISLCVSAHAETLRIVVAGDGRADYPWIQKRPEDVGGLNRRIVREICQAVIKEKAKVMLWTGDIVNVNETAGPRPEDKTNYLNSGLQTWRKIMDPLYQKHITVLPVRGNHEVEWHKKKGKTPSDIPNATAVWRQVFGDLPDNGPVGEKKLSFCYATDSVLCIGLDQYGKRQHSVDQPWLERVLAQNKKRFVFAYGHEPAFVPGGSHTRNESLAAYPHSRDQMWESLAGAGARVYLCGHDHFYDHMKVQRNATPEMHQFTAGTAGAPFYSHKPYPEDEDWRLKQIKHADFVYGYILITIEGNAATIAFKGRNPNGEYVVKDSFHYTASSPTN